MYEKFFSFTSMPFSIAPDPKFLYMSSRHREALAHLIYGEKNNGLVLLTGEVGTGKTTICRYLLSDLPDNVETAFIINPKVVMQNKRKILIMMWRKKRKKKIYEIM